MPLRVASEAGVLRQVILHEPGLEMERLTPENKDALLFDDTPWVAEARRDHQVFQRTLTDNGVTVHLFGDLLAQTLARPEASAMVLDRVCDPRQGRLGLGTARVLREMFDAMDAREQARYLIGGVNKAEVVARTGPSRTLGLDVLHDDDFVIDPLPNHLFTRDASCWVYGGVSVNPMRLGARKRETIHYEAVYRHHPLFSSGEFTVLRPGEAGGPAATEGGDVEVLGNGTVALGLGERTTAAGAEILAHAMFTTGEVRRVIAIELPRTRAAMHLDTVMTMVDRDAFCFYAGLDAATVRSWTLTPDGSGGMRVETNRSLFDAVARALELPRVRVLQTVQDSYAAAREQWNDGVNVLAVAPGMVVSYSRNENANRMLRENGVTVFEVLGAELGRGRGGPRCMSCPIERDAL